MRGKLIKLKYAGRCADKNCGAELTVGQDAYWYRGGRVYCANGHKNSSNEYSGGVRWDARRGTAVQSNGRCEDAPCCGCCGGIEMYSAEYDYYGDY